MELQYTLTRKDINNIILKVAEDGTIQVSAPHGASTRRIEQLIRENEEAIRKTIAKRNNNRDIFQKGVSLDSIDRLYYLGNAYNWHIELVGKRSLEGVQVDRQEMIIYAADYERSERVLLNWYKNQLVMMIRRLAEEIYPHFRTVQPTFPMIQYRNMTSRWGSCNKMEGKLTFNIRLIQYPPRAIEYVVWHEFVHFVHPNHSKGFWDTVESFMPDYKKHQACLRDEKGNY